ncbi:MAG: U32 family peptidase [Anaeroplasma sp.]
MEIVCSVYNLNQLNKNICSMDAAILMIPNISLIYENLDIDIAITICKKNNIIPILAVNKLYKPFEFNELTGIIDKYAVDKDVLFYVTDIGVAYYAIKLGIGNRVIFNPETMITNSYDLKIYSEYNFKALAMSSEITYFDLVKSYNEVKADLFQLVFGHRLMFYSNRNLISLYEKKAGINIPKNNTYLKEATREDLYPIYENDNGTMIYRSYLVSYANVLNELGFLKYLYCDSLAINDEIFSKVLKLFYDYSKEKICYEALNLEINKLNLNIQDGFMYCDSVYQKEELKNE